jgi:acylaminoacyl-peptidase
LHQNTRRDEKYRKTLYYSISTKIKEKETKMKESYVKHLRLKIFLCVFCLGLPLLAVSPVVAGEQPGVITAKDVFDFEFVNDPQISPDGKRIVYARGFADIMSDQWCSNLWIINFDGSEHRPLTTGKTNDGSPRWSPDGKQIIYISTRDGSPQVYKLKPDTGQTQVLTNIKTPPIGNLAWSPDGKHIGFSAFVPSGQRKIAEMPSPPPGAKWAKPAMVIDRLKYRAAGIGYVSGYIHLFVMPAEGGIPRQISKGNFNHLGNIAWTPDSKYILMAVNRKDEFEYYKNATEIYEFKVADGMMRALTDRKGPDSTPAVSPDGKYIAYTGFNDRFRSYQVTKLYIMNRDGSNKHVITKKLDRSVSNITWAVDSRGLYFTYCDKGNTKLAYVTLKGKVKVLTGNLGDGIEAYGHEGTRFSIAAGHDNKSPEDNNQKFLRGGPGGAVFSKRVPPGENFAITYTRPDISSTLAVGNVNDPKVKLLTSVNRDIFAHKKFGQVEEIRYKSSFDGRDIQGWIIKPPNFDPSKKYPLVLEIHGGPFANYGDRFDLRKQLIAASGYVVLYTNSRGSTGYGEEFANLIHHAYPGNDFYDLNSGVDAVIAKGYIDENNLFVTGESGGGTLTCWMIGKTNRFKAAASLNPVINMYSWVLTTDMSVKSVKYYSPGMPWDNVEHYEKRSVLFVVKNVKTPTMIMCGEKDIRTPISETEQYYKALKLLGVEAVLVRLPDEPHGMSKRPSHFISVTQHIIGWFAPRRGDL